MTGTLLPILFAIAVCSIVAVTGLFLLSFGWDAWREQRRLQRPDPDLLKSVRKAETERRHDKREP
jgi:hypothetical protein